MRVVVVWRSMRPLVSAMLVLHYLDDVADGVGEADVVVVASVVASSSRARRSSEDWWISQLYRVFQR